MTSQFRVNNDFYGSFVEALRITGAEVGIQPFIQVRKTASQNLVNNAYADINNSDLTLVNKTGNISSNYADNNGAPLTITIDETGYYFLQSNVWIRSEDANRLTYIVRITYGANASSASGLGTLPVASANNTVGAMSQVLVKLNAGDVVFFNIYTVSATGGPVTLFYSTNDNGIYRATFTAARLF